MSLWQIFTSEYRISTRLILDIEYRISTRLILDIQYFFKKIIFGFEFECHSDSCAALKIMCTTSASSRRWVRGCHRGHPSANCGYAAVNGSVAVGGSRQAGYGPTYFFRGVGSQCPSDMPELDRGVTPNLVMPFWRASAQQRGHAKPGDAFLACQRSTGGSPQAWR